MKLLNVSGFLLAAKNGYDADGHWYAKCKAASKVFKRPLSKMALYGYGMSTTSNVMYSVRGFLGVPKDTWNVIAPTG
jgi:hypothetical protein